VNTTTLAVIILTLTVVAVTLTPMAPMLTPTHARVLPTVNTSLVEGRPVGLMAYTGPTWAVAGYYCMRGIPGSGWSIMLNAYLNNGFVIQDIIGSEFPIPLPIFTNYVTNIWLINNTGAHLIHARQLPIAFTCGWLVIRLVNGTAYIGFSPDGTHAIWFDAYHVGNGSIIMASIVMGGDGDGSTAIVGKSLTVPLALYYWNGTAWLPVIAPTPVDANVLEAVNHAWASVSARCSSVASWPTPVGYTLCPSPPAFEG
jgi:hypothetical protein